MGKIKEVMVHYQSNIWCWVVANVCLLWLNVLENLQRKSNTATLPDKVHVWNGPFQEFQAGSFIVVKW